METQRYGRRAFHVDAVQVTDDNMSEVAAWCGGTIEQKSVKGQLENYVDVPTHRPINEKQKQAFAGDWVLKSNTGFKVYTDKAFKSSFTKAEGTRNVFEQNEVVELSPEDPKETEPTSKITISQQPDEPTTREALGLSDPKQVFFRSSVTGRAVTKQFALDNPDTTVREEI